MQDNPLPGKPAALKENRSLERGLIVLETLAQNPAMSLSDIHRATGLPKSTLRRLLATLIKRRFIRHSISDRLFRIAVTLPDLSVEPVPPRLAVLADIGLGHALDLTAKIGWPSDIHAMTEHWSQIVETTRSVSPYGLYQVQIDLRVSLFGSAAGTVCLSEMPEDQVRALFDNPDIGPMQSPDRFNLTWPSLQRHLHKVREQGYGERIPNFIGEIVQFDKLSVIALPLRKQKEVAGAITLLWPKQFLSIEQFAKTYLQDLSDTVEKIENDLDNYTAKQKKLEKQLGE